MRLLLLAASILGRGCRSDIAIEGGRIAQIHTSIDPKGFDRVIDLSQTLLIPGFVDVHVHLREPGFSYKETIKTGTRSAARGGFTRVCAMPNLSPAPDSLEHLQVQLDLIARDACVQVHPYGSITVGQSGEGELVDFEALWPYVCGFSDDGRGVQEEATMRRAMERVARLGGIIVAHCEDDRELLSGGSVHAGVAAQKFGLTGISSKSEWVQLERDLKLAAQTGCRYHVCHVSTKESVQLIREAKARGVDVSCETAPHYLLLSDEDLLDEGCFKMNPPIRAREDRDALVIGLLDGTIDMIATDHAPHSAQEKSKGLSGSIMGVVGLESAFALMYTHFVVPGHLTLRRLVELMSLAPRHRFGLAGAEIAVGQLAELTALDLGAEYTIDSDEFLSMGRSTPFAGWTVSGRVRLTLNGQIAYEYVK